MALPGTQQQREYNNFADVGDGTTARQVTVVGGSGSGLATEATLQSVNSKLADLKTYTDQLEQYVDGLEGLNTSILASSTAIEGYLDGVESLITATNSALSTINSSLSTINSAVDQLEGYTDGVESLLTTIIGHVDGLETQLTGIQASLTSIDNDFDVALSTRASEATLALIKTRADLLATETTLSALNNKFDVNLSTRASETTLSSALTQLQEINAGTPAALGQTTMANSQPVVLASDQSTLPVSAASLPLPSGAATSANQATANASLASIDAGIPAALGQATEADSMPVTIASDQDYPFANAHNSSNPAQAISIGADDTANIRRLQGRISDPVANDFGLIVRQVPRWPQTFIVHADNVTIGNGKSMLSLFNASGSGVIIRIHRIKIFNVRTTAVTGVVAEFALRKITAHSAGTSLDTTGSASGLVFPLDSTNSLNGSVTARTGATVTESPAFDIINWFWSSDEWGVGTQDVESLQHAFAQSVPAFESKDGTQPFVMRENQGFHIRQTTNSTAGSFDIEFLFTQETV